MLTVYSYVFLSDMQIIIWSFCHSSSENVFNVLDYLKPIAEEERRQEEAEKKIREEQERIYKQLSEGNTSPTQRVLKTVKILAESTFRRCYCLLKPGVFCVFSPCSKLGHYPQMRQFQTRVKMFQM